MILVITKTQDATADYVLDKMYHRNVDCARLNTDVFASDGGLQVGFDGQDSIYTGSQEIALEDVDSIWFRRYSKPEVLGVENKEAQAFASQEWDFALRWTLECVDCPIIDLEANILQARNKFAQLELATKQGFRTPQTLITADPNKAREFVLHSSKQTVLKSIGGFGSRRENGFEAVYTTLVTAEIMEKFDAIKLAPVCLQEYIDKAYELRVTVVGDQIFACKIDSQATERTQVDWRRYDSNTPYTAFELDSSTISKLSKIMNFFEVSFASFDFVVTPDDELFFLEMNPNSQFVWIEELTGLPITDVLIDLLLSSFLE